MNATCKMRMYSTHDYVKNHLFRNRIKNRKIRLFSGAVYPFAGNERTTNGSCFIMLHFHAHVFVAFHPLECQCIVQRQRDTVDERTTNSREQRERDD